MPTLLRRQVSLRAFVLSGAAVLLSLLSCGREITGPGGGHVRFAHGMSFLSFFPAPLASVEAGAGSVVAFDKVRVVFLRSDQSVALDRTIPFPADSSQLSLRLSVPISSDAPRSGEPMAMLLRYLNAANDTVFSGGPVAVTAIPNNSNSPPPEPVEVELVYTGPGAQAASLVISPDTITVLAGEAFAFTAQAFDGQQAVVADAPVVWTTLDATRASLTAAAAGAGTSLPPRGAAQIRATLVTGAGADTATLIILPRPDALELMAGGAQSAAPGAPLSLPIRVRLRATDGAGIADSSIAILPSGDGSVPDSLLVTDANGEVSVPWTLGTAAGAQTLTFSGGGVANLVVNATAVTSTGNAVRLAIVSDNSPSQVAGNPVTPALVVEAVDAQGVLVTDFTGAVTLQPILQPAESNLLGGVGVTAVAGVATFDDWTADRVGTYQVAVVADGLVPDTSIAFSFGPSSPDSIGLVSGGGQTAYVSDTVPEPIAVVVLDSLGNRVPGDTVTFTVIAGGGLLTNPTAVTDTLGIASLRGWVLGPNAGLNEIQATSGSATPLTIGATGELPPPEVQLSVFGSNVVGVDRAGTLNVRLLQAAPAGGITVTVTSDNPELLTINAPGTVAFAEGATLGSIGVSGIALGNAVVRGDAPGYTSDTLVVPVSLNLITVPPTLTVPLAQTTSWPLSLSAPAPAGGVVLALTSDNPGIAQPTVDSVTIPAGSQSANVNVEGLALGDVTLRATNPNYALDETVATVAAGVDLTATSYNINQSFGLPATIRLVSGGSPVAAPPGGVTIALSTADSTCASVPPSATIAQGFTSVTVNVVYGGSAVAPCSTRLYAIGPQSFTNDSATVNVAVQPNTGLQTLMYLGSGLQRLASSGLSASNHGGTTVRVWSSDPARLLVAPNATTLGSDSIDIAMGINATGYNFVVQALEGLLNDTLYVYASAPGFLTDSLRVLVFEAGIELIGINGSATTLSTDDAFQVRIGSRNTAVATFLNSIDGLRFGADTLRASVSTDSSGILSLVRTEGVADSIELRIAPTASSSPSSVAAGGAAVRYVGQGTDSIRVVAPGFFGTSSATRAVTVSQPSISFLTALTVGSGLRRAASVSLSQAAVDTVVVTLAYDVPGVALLSADDNVLGADTLRLTFAPGVSNIAFDVQALEGFSDTTVTLNATAPGFTSRTASHRVLQPVVEIIGLSGSGTTLQGDDAFYARIGTPNTPTGTFLNTVDQVRVGGVPLTVSFLNDSLGIGTLVVSDSAADSLALTINPLQSNTPTSVAAGGVAFRYLAEGVTTVRASAPPARPLASAQGSQVTVTQPSLNVATSLSIGAGLQRNTSLSLSQASPDTVRVRLALDTTGVALISDSAGTVGSDTLELVLPPGTTFRNFYIQALEGVVPDTLRMHASAPGFLGDSIEVRVWEPVLEIIGIAANPTSLNANDDFYVRTGTPSSPSGTFLSNVDELRAGSPGVNIRVASSVPTVGQLVTSTLTSDTITLTLAAGQTNTPTTVGAGGIAFDPLTAGTTVVSAVAPGFRDIAGANVTVNVIPPEISLGTGNANVGAGLQVNQGGSFNTSGHNGRAVTIRSSNPAVLLVAPNAGTPATDSIVINVAAGQSSFSYFIAGVEGSTGTVNITASADGFLDGVVSKNVVAPAIQVNTNLATSGTAGVTADDPFTVSVGIPDATQAFITQSQAVRAGQTLSVTVASSEPTFGTLVTLTDSIGAGSVTTVIAGSASLSPSSVAAGGVAFRFVAPGTTTVSATATGFQQVTGGQRIVTVNAP